MDPIRLADPILSLPCRANFFNYSTWLKPEPEVRHPKWLKVQKFWVHSSSNQYETLYKSSDIEFRTQVEHWWLSPMRDHRCENGGKALVAHLGWGKNNEHLHKLCFHGCRYRRVRRVFFCPLWAVVVNTFHWIDNSLKNKSCTLLVMKILFYVIFCQLSNLFHACSSKSAAY